MLIDLQTLFRIMAIGLVAGWLAGVILKGRGFGIAGDIIVGIFGAIVGAWMFSLLGLAAYGVVGSILMSMCGAMVFLGLVGFVVRHA